MKTVRWHTFRCSMSFAEKSFGFGSHLILSKSNTKHQSTKGMFHFESLMQEIHAPQEAWV